MGCGDIYISLVGVRVSVVLVIFVVLVEWVMMIVVILFLCIVLMNSVRMCDVVLGLRFFVGLFVRIIVGWWISVWVIVMCCNLLFDRLWV